MDSPGKYCDEFWPGWRQNIEPNIEVSDIGDYNLVLIHQLHMGC